jgi:hypothetical protein
MVSLYLFAKESNIVKNPHLPLCIFSTFPITWKVLAQKSLYLEIPFVFYTMSSFFLCYKALKKPSAVNYLFLSASLFNLALSKELGFFMTTLFLAIIFATLFKQFPVISKISYVLFFTSMFNVLFFVDILSGNAIYAMFRETLVIFFSFAIFSLSKEMWKVTEKSETVSLKSFDVLKLSVVSFFMLMLLLFTVKNFLELGSFTYHTGPAYGEFARFISQLHIETIGTDILNMLSFYRVLTSSGFISIYLVFFSVGFSILLKHRYNFNYSFLGVAFTYVVLMWATILLSASSGDDFRRLYCFAPFAAVIVAMGFESIFKKYKNEIQNVFVIFNSILILTLYLIFYKGDCLGALFWRFDIFEYVNLTSLLIGFFATIISLVALNYLKFKHLFNYIRKNNINLFLLILQLLLAAILIPPVIVYVNQYGWDPEIYYQIQHENFGYNIFEVVNYLNQLNNSYSVVSIFGHYIPFYTDRTCIELTGHEGYLTLKSMLSQEDYLMKFEVNRVKYILLPERDFPERVANMKDLYVSKLPNFESLLTRDSVPIRVFQYFTLYEIMYPREIDNIVDYDAQMHYFIKNSEPFSSFLKKNITSIIGGYNFVTTNEVMNSFVLKVKARAIKYGNSPWDTYRLVFGYLNYTHFFDVYLDENGLLVLSEVRNGRSPIIELHTSLDPYQWHEWSILYRDGMLTIIVDDTYEIVRALPIEITGKVGYLVEPNSVSEISRLRLSTYLILTS